MKIPIIKMTRKEANQLIGKAKITKENLSTPLKIFAELQIKMWENFDERLKKLEKLLTK